MNRVIKIVKPDVIHSLEMQSGAYLVNEAKKVYKGKFPPWIVSNWGSDIYLFGKQEGHKQKIREVLSNCDYYMCECQRDVKLAKKFGFHGEVLGVLPNAGGYDIKKYSRLGKNPPSKRNAIMVKGYQGWAGRSLVALSAIDEIGHTLSKKGFRLIVYSTVGNKAVENRAKDIADKYELQLIIVPQYSPHETIIRLHGESRISIGLSISDGISTSLLESMATGSFPIQSYTACVDEWIIDGISGILVSPNNKSQTVKALKRAIKDDELVDKAAFINHKIIKERVSYQKIRKQTLQIYRDLLNNNHKSV